MTIPFSIVLLSLFMMIYHTPITNVGERQVTYTDHSRERPLKSQIWYPTTGTNFKNTQQPFVLPPTVKDAEFIQKKYPLVVLSHGTGGNRYSLSWLAIELAKDGYVVIAPDHWGNTLDNKIPENFVRYWDRPLDMSFLISSLLDDPVYNSYIDSSKIAGIGFSLGGYTTLALAGVKIDCDKLKINASIAKNRNQFVVPELGDLQELIQKIPCNQVPENLKDSRFKVNIALSPALGLGLSEEKQSTKSSVLIIGAADDSIAPLASNALKYSEVIKGSKYSVLPVKTGHYVFLNEGKSFLVNEEPTFYYDHETIDRKSVHRQVASEIKNFLREHLK
ncbi:MULTISPECIES: alpha/beta hydrolase family protein [unclassified Sphingobacterium]|uniref:alpha/beta hydrolase family protein n=1 Tax=unclassified Sphingobacterium TaxID=2609468 RepID=UPI0025D74208|nr:MULTISPECIES: dienelactone hydrolase family protein [unclassified Sphingobacterium]